MTALASLLAVVLIGLAAAWLFGSFIPRIIGVLLVLAGLVGLATGTTRLVAIGTAVLGALAWLAGHWIYAYRHHEYRGPARAARVSASASAASRPNARMGHPDRAGWRRVSPPHVGPSPRAQLWQQLASAGR